ncbi:DUF488 family protein [Leucobacter rhizosphaerae]|uniref:DUF488 family protein n=1 Tax=Leucobacter rhizosphaerae TaxID=2932245 RepID=A0ABY4FWU8_9MICO|nr:DUF488 family protein [Leucobacter rhizosphaerae]UOQ60599.1 DUF488 family protein [Leucobacter rhizosphaerae]
MDIVVKRVYDPPGPDDGVRVLVDRLWPRGVSKAAASLAEWAKDAAPSSGLRRTWHGDPAQHSPAHFEAFATAYRAELAREPGARALDALLARAAGAERLTLLTATRDPEQNHARVLRAALLERATRPDRAEG